MFLIVCPIAQGFINKMPKSAMAEGYEINIPSEYFNPSFYPFLERIYNYEIYWGGRNSGKSKFICQKKVMHLSTISGRNMICMRTQATDCRNSCFNEIYKTIYELHLDSIWNIRENPDMRMTNKINGNEIVFTGMDKVENIKSITFKHGNATDLWYEEVTEEQDVETMTVIDNSLRSYGKKCSLLVSFNPVLATHWIKKWMEEDLKGSDVLIHHSTYKDNKWVDKEYAFKLEKLKYSDPYRYRVDCLGLWGTAGETVFDANKIADRLRSLQTIQGYNPPMRIAFGYEQDSNDLPIIETIKPFESIVGETLVYVAPNVKHPYVAAMDTAGEGIDYYAMHVFDNITDEQVAVFHSLKLADECLIQVYGLLKMYNDALIAPEVNFSEYPLLKFKEWGYTNIYQREKPATSKKDGYEKSYGFRTTSGNRQSIIDNLIDWSKTNINKINDIDTLNEMLSFTRQVKKNKGIFMGAESGTHDDLVIALAILLKAKEQQVCEEVAEMKHIEGYWTKGELEAALYKGRVDEDAVREYMLSAEHFQKNNLRRRSRYAR
jgi:phage terminase large subunit